MMTFTHNEYLVNEAQLVEFYNKFFNKFDDYNVEDTMEERHHFVQRVVSEEYDDIYTNIDRNVGYVKDSEVAIEQVADYIVTKLADTLRMDAGENYFVGHCLTFQEVYYGANS